VKKRRWLSPTTKGQYVGYFADTIYTHVIYTYIYIYYKVFSFQWGPLNNALLIKAPFISKKKKMIIIIKIIIIIIKIYNKKQNKKSKFYIKKKKKKW